MMTLAEFKKKYRWDSLFVVERSLSVGYIGVSGLFLMIVCRKYILLMLIFFIVFVVPGVSALFYMRFRLKLIRWDNGLSQNQNVELLRKVASKLNVDGFILRDKKAVLLHENYLNMIYNQTSIKGLQLRLFAGEGYILFNGHREDATLEDFFNTAPASRFQKEILQFMKDSV